ncbi:hypothetical protein AGMMS49944_09060 [Spirochaetia bacterium]|nr:hypothetical protein AGMMS49944_09060 [Spirochaetia bacterium]
MNEYGLTEKGFIVKPYTEIFKEEQLAFQGAFGMDIDLSDDSIEGVYIRNQAMKISQLWELLGGLYAIGDVDDAWGIYLDRLVNFVNVSRLPANATRVYECLWGDEGTLLYKGHVIRLPNGPLFKLNTNTTISRNSLLGFQIEVKTVTVGHTYSLTLSAKIVAYTAVSGDAEQQIQEGLAAAIEVLFPGSYQFLNQGKDGLRVNSKTGVQPFSVDISDTLLDFVMLGGYGIYVCTETGEVSVPSGALTKIVSGVNGLESAVNYATGITGRIVESDTELRLRLSARQKQATANEVAIENAILGVNGVQYCRVYSNRDIIEINGRPPKSYESVVIGGDEQDIAQTIFEKGPAGIQAFGSIVKVVADDGGFDWNIGFSRPTNKYIWVKISCSTNHEEQLSDNWTTEIKDNIVDWSKNNINVATDLIYQKLFRPVYDVKGIGFADIKVAVTDDLVHPGSGAYVSENIEIQEVEIALIDQSRIDITELVG